MNLSKHKGDKANHDNYPAIFLVSVTERALTWSQHFPNLVDLGLVIPNR